MPSKAKPAAVGTKPGKKSAEPPVRRAPRGTDTSKPKRSEKDVAIATELAPAVAITLLGQSDHVKGQPAAALEPLAAGAVASDADGKVRVQLLFENGAVLPIEMSDATAAALGKGIAKELHKG